mmetsp:Transcript_4479/g.17624  ORF Transcript_4479/g.17624 Transcript_4479/m.17624 type:complete len:205 (-) Transcript_4479:1945-2559(-)
MPSTSLGEWSSSWTKMEGSCCFRWRSCFTSLCDESSATRASLPDCLSSVCRDSFSEQMLHSAVHEGNSIASGNAALISVQSSPETRMYRDREVVRFPCSQEMALFTFTSSFSSIRLEGLVQISVSVLCFPFSAEPALLSVPFCFATCRRRLSIDCLNLAAQARDRKKPPGDSSFLDVSSCSSKPSTRISRRWPFSSSEFSRSRP